MNSNILICCEYHVHRFIDEYIKSLLKPLNAKLLLTQLESYQYNNTDTYIFIQKIPNKLLNNPIKNMYLLNIEQATIPKYNTMLSNLLAKNIKVFDYSSENIKIMNDNHNMIHLPYQYNEYEINNLKKHINATSNKIYDCVFVGHLSPKRKKIYDELVTKGIKMLNIDGKWGDDRDKAISNAKLLLNVHFDENYNIYEVLRCDRWALAGMIVVSEKSLYSDSLDISDLVVFEDYDKLVNKIITIVCDYDSYYEMHMGKYNKISSIIKDNRLKSLTDIKENVLYKNNMQNKLVDNTLEIFSANWVCNFQKPSFVKLGNQKLNLHRGFNLICLKGKQLSLIKYFDTCIEDCSAEIQKYVKNIYDKKEYDYLILVTHDDAVCKMSSTILQNYLIFIGCKELYKLQFRASYSLVYNLQNREIVSEICDNQYPIHEWFELIDNKLENLGIPVYLIVYNLLYFVKNSVEQLKKYTKNIHIIDNKSTYPKLLEYYDTEYEFFLDKMDANYGHLVWMRQMYGNFPRVFAMSDPDLQFNPNLPANFLQTMKELSNKYKKGKIGWALDLSDAELFYKEKEYTEGVCIEEWEKRFWIRKVDDPAYELYTAAVDTTFCIVNKEFEERGNALRIAGDFTCKHIPWYEGWQKKLDPDEWEFYKRNNISSSTVKMIMKTYNDTHKQTIELFNEMDTLINKINECTTKINKASNLSDGDKAELKSNLDNSVNCVTKNKVKLSEIVQQNMNNA